MALTDNQRQQIFLEYVNAIQARGLRHALANSATALGVKVVRTGAAAGTVPAGEMWVVFMVTEAEIEALPEKAFGNELPALGTMPT